MAHNAHFLPTVSHAISVSWPRNIQSPSLRQKLSRLANSPVSQLLDEGRDEDGEAGTSARLAAVVQSRLWGMMQRKLYDPSDAAKIWRKSALQENPGEDDEYPDLLAAVREQGKVAAELGEFGDDEDEFEDLIPGDDEGLLGYWEERERLSIECETEEMLFRSGWDEEEKVERDVCLLDDGAGDDFMLI
jgi:hypothetical protein